MNQFDVVRGFLEYGETGAPSPDRLAGGFLEAMRALGIRHFACCSHVDPFHPPSAAVMLHNYPGGWVRTYSEARLYETDPVLKFAEISPLAFFWDIALKSAPITPSQKTMMADAAGYGITHGYTVPLRLSWMPGSLRASCTVIPDGEHVDPPSCFAIEVAATYLHFKVCCARAPWLAAPPVHLTQRERECLALVAQGKPDWIIGRVMGLGASTAHFHVERLKRRFGVVTRQQAVVQGLLSGQISYGEVVRPARGKPARQGDPAAPAVIGGPYRANPVPSARRPPPTRLP